jgi:hypothetical protein
VLVYFDAGGQAGTLQSPREAGRVEHGRALLLPEAGPVERGVQFLADGVPVQEHHVRILALVLAQPLHLVVLGGDAERARPFEAAVDSVLLHGVSDLLQVLQPQLLQASGFPWQVLLAVGLAVGQAGLAETAVAPGCRPADPLAFQQHHAPVRIAFLGH